MGLVSFVKAIQELGIFLRSIDEPCLIFVKPIHAEISELVGFGH